MHVGPRACCRAHAGSVCVCSCTLPILCEPSQLQWPLGPPLSSPSNPTPPSHPPQGVVTLNYKGPLPIGYGLRAAVRDKFPDIVEVLMIDPDKQEPIKFEAI